MSALILPFVLGRWSPLIAFGLFLALWVFASTLANLRQRLASTPRSSLLEKLRANSSSYYGMLLAHLGVGVFVTGVTLVKGYEVERDVRLDVGESVSVGAYDFVKEALDKLREETDIDLDPERKAAMVSNLLVVLVSDKDATPVVNTGTLYA